MAVEIDDTKYTVEDVVTLTDVAMIGINDATSDFPETFICDTKGYFQLILQAEIPMILILP